MSLPNLQVEPWNQGPSVDHYTSELQQQTIVSIGGSDGIKPCQVAGKVQALSLAAGPRRWLSQHNGMEL